MNLKVTTAVSRVLTDLMTAALCLLCGGLPWIAREYLTAAAHLKPMPALWVVLVLGYLALAGGLFLCALMRWILRRVRKGNIFHSPSDWIIRGLGISCFYEAVVFGVLAVWFPISGVVAFAGVFLGVALLVVADLVGAATALKEENDFTV